MLAVAVAVLFGGLFMIISGLPLVLMAAFEMVQQAKLHRRAIGTVVGSEVDSDGGWQAIVEFTTGDQRLGRFHNASSSWREPSVGRSVPVRYDPDDLNVGRIATFFGSWSGPAILLLIGGPVVVLGAMLATGLA